MGKTIPSKQNKKLYDLQAEIIHVYDKIDKYRQFTEGMVKSQEAHGRQNSKHFFAGERSACKRILGILEEIWPWLSS